MILVSGASGKTGRAIVAALADVGMAVRALVRRTEQIEQVREAGASEWIVGDMLEPRTWTAACDGVQAMYHICPNLHPQELAIATVAVDAAHAARCQHVVYHSVLHPQTQAMPHHWRKLEVEEMLFTSGLAFTILQPAPYMQNVLASWPLIQAGRYRVPYAASTRLGMIDLDDVAAVAARVLTQPNHIGAIYELAGPEILDQRQVAEVLSRQLGHSVTVEVQSRDEWQQQARAAGLGGYQVESLVKMFAYYEQYGLWGNARVLTWLLGRPPTSFVDFVARMASTA